MLEKPTLCASFCSAIRIVMRVFVPIIWKVPHWALLGALNLKIVGFSDLQKQDDTMPLESGYLRDITTVVTCRLFAFCSGSSRSCFPLYLVALSEQSQFQSQYSISWAWGCRSNSRQTTVTQCPNFHQHALFYAQQFYLCLVGFPALIFTLLKLHHIRLSAIACPGVAMSNFSDLVKFSPRKTLLSICKPAKYSLNFSYRQLLIVVKTAKGVLPPSPLVGYLPEP
ncbi:uncharacterized protein ASCRUDRAFT_110496 [Ascoidea rubescens DSM 1968]|uniref:Uncharacterized protein n=1 Tax=Ascoidea rubescens DSM 1968 TaxID=1344418 RepID=A0A1D2VDI5_9ASCO|nr:hypothetical protein ASCRUDRAFT_110496 [Ascoidea rubescens DSM 1968]ODV59659.1 hypothetical protein ASCRUDRAFT_110496 [Ascoidea rubescens DSM 1968]